MDTIRCWHRQRGFADVGYHFVILENGLVEKGRPLKRTGAHVRGFNTDSVGVCLIGIEDFTEEQEGALRGLLDMLLKKYPNAEVCGHCDLDPKKTCPNFDVGEWLVSG